MKTRDSALLQRDVDVTVFMDEIDSVPNSCGNRIAPTQMWALQPE